MKQNCLCKTNKNNTILLSNKVRFGKKANVLKCKKCSLVYLDQKSFKFPKSFYEKEYHQTYITHVEPDALNPKKYYDKMLLVTKIWSDKLKKKLKGNEIILDVGCSTGHFIKNIEFKAKKVYGHELSAKEVEFCRKKLNLDVDNIPLHNRFKKKTFDYITLIFVLEHIANPWKFLKYISKFLKHNGKLIILVPNINDALINFYNIPAFKEFYFCIEHLYYYSPKTIKRIFDDVGLKGKIECIQEYPITNHINWAFNQKPSDVVRSRKNLPDIELINNKYSYEWIKLWKKFSMSYKDFLLKKGFSDRIWCEISKIK